MKKLSKMFLEERLFLQEDLDFGSDLYALAESSTDELLSSWKALAISTSG